MRTALLLPLFLAGSYRLLARQTPFYPKSAGHRDVGNVPVMKDSLVTKSFFRSTWLWASMELVPWSFDKLVKKADYANISWKTVGYNLHPGSWRWDGDGFVTNQLGPPFPWKPFL